jgi:hypothetical protein
MPPRRTKTPRIVLVSRLLRDERVPRRRKLLLVALVGYLALPFDLVPDFIPVAGQLDDVLVVAFVLGASFAQAASRSCASTGPDLSSRSGSCCAPQGPDPGRARSINAQESWRCRLLSSSRFDSSSSRLAPCARTSRRVATSVSMRSLSRAITGDDCSLTLMTFMSTSLDLLFAYWNTEERRRWDFRTAAS